MNRWVNWTLCIIPSKDSVYFGTSYLVSYRERRLLCAARFRVRVDTTHGGGEERAAVLSLDELRALVDQ